jgi:hypothetical protein
MRTGLVGLIVVAAGIAAALTEIIVFSVVHPPDEFWALQGGLWVAMPYLAAVGLALLLRRHHAPLIVLLVALLVAAGLGLPLFANSAGQHAAAEQQVKTAVLPGEDPSRGPAGMRKSGAEASAAITWGVSVVLAVVLPPVQLALVVIPTAIGYLVYALAWRRGKGADEGADQAED